MSILTDEVLDDLILENEIDSSVGGHQYEFLVDENKVLSIWQQALTKAVSFTSSNSSLQRIGSHGVLAVMAGSSKRFLIESEG